MILPPLIIRDPFAANVLSGRSCPVYGMDVRFGVDSTLTVTIYHRADDQDAVKAAVTESGDHVFGYARASDGAIGAKPCGSVLVSTSKDTLLVDLLAHNMITQRQHDAVRALLVEQAARAGERLQFLLEQCQLPARKSGGSMARPGTISRGPRPGGH